MNDDCCFDTPVRNEITKVNKIFKTELAHLPPPTTFSDKMKCYQSFYSGWIVTCTAWTLSLHISTFLFRRKFLFACCFVTYILLMLHKIQTTCGLFEIYNAKLVA